jgi:beta-barrel assembly-enhancing protease
MKYVPKVLVETADISRGRQGPRQALVNVCLVLATFLLLYLALGLLGELLARFIPDRWEQRLAFTRGLLESTETRSLEHPQAILDKLIQDQPLRTLEYRLFLLNLNAPNAVALPGGGIGLTPDLLDLLETEIGLAFVIAHELGHHQHRHLLRAMGRRLLLSLAGTLFFDSSGVAAVNRAFETAETRFSRQQELAADTFALTLLWEQYGTTEGAFEFFEKLQETHREYAWQKYLGSHPLTRERILHLERLQLELAGSDGSD